MIYVRTCHHDLTRKMDVVCVKAENRENRTSDGIEFEYYSTQFYVRFSKVLPPDIQNVVNSSQTIDLEAEGHGFENGLGNIAQSNKASSLILVQSSSKKLTQDGEYVDVYCNNRNCGLSAVVGPGHLVHFIDPYSQCAVTTPTSNMLHLFNLNKGKNRVVCKHRNSGDYKEFYIWLYDFDDKFVIMDIDGTITKSNVTGYFQTVYLGLFTYIHDGLTPFLNNLTQSLRLNVIYLTSRPMTHQRETRSLLAGIAAENGI